MNDKEILKWLTDLIVIMDDTMTFDPDHPVSQRDKATETIESLCSGAANLPEALKDIDSTDSRTAFCMGMCAAAVAVRAQMKEFDGGRRPQLGVHRDLPDM
ncbi:MAG TPA: hypothetical protein VEG60_29900 [Candidatus Binatia bacterium]|nr:hypothetical protein [Candidatus Binatia bacterium]